MREKIADCLMSAMHVNVPTFAFIGVVTLSDAREIMHIILAIVTIICTLAVTRHKLKNRK